MKGYSSSGTMYDRYVKLPFIPLNKGGGHQVLDLGSNEGFFSIQAALHGAERVIGVERTPEDLALANDIRGLLGLEDRVEFLAADAKEYVLEIPELLRLVILNYQLYSNMEGSEAFIDALAQKSEFVAFETPANHPHASTPLRDIAEKLREHFAVVRLLHVYDAYSSGYRANFVCYSRQFSDTSFSQSRSVWGSHRHSLGPSCVPGGNVGECSPMAYDEKLADRVRTVLLAFSDAAPTVDERKMFGGLCFTLSGNMCCGIVDKELMLRVGPDAHQAVLARTHARPMDFTGRPMKGMVYVGVDGLKTKAALHKWITYAVGFASSLPPKVGKKAAKKKATKKKA